MLQPLELFPLPLLLLLVLCPNFPPLLHLRRVIRHACHLQDVTPEQRLSLSLLKIYEPWISYFQLIYLVVCFHFFFSIDAGHFTVRSRFQISVSQTLIHYNFAPLPLAGCR